MYRRLAALRGDESGAVAVFVVLGMGLLLGGAAMAIDVGHMMNARTESQRVADLAALAGAAAFIEATGNADQTARAWAGQYAAANTIDRIPVSLQSEDIAVDIAKEQVRVTVRNTAARGNPIATVFARVLGITSVDIVTTAVAEASGATAVNCVLPLMLPDRWTELGGNPLQYDPDIDHYEAWNPDGSNDGTYTGYAQANLGDTVSIKSNTGPGFPEQNSYYPVGAGGLSPGGSYRDHFSMCPDEAQIYTLDDMILPSPARWSAPPLRAFGI